MNPIMLKHNITNKIATVAASKQTKSMENLKEQTSND